MGAPQIAPTDADLDRLVAAAWRVLDRSGWRGLKVESVLREAQLSTRFFYRHFAGKNELLLALLDDEVQRGTARTRAVVAAHEDPVDQLKAWIAVVVGFAYRKETSRRTRMFVGLWREAASDFPEETMRNLRDCLQPLMEIIGAGRATGAFPDADPEDAALAIYHLASSAAADASRGGWSSRDQQERTVIAFALRALTGVASADASAASG